MSRRTDAALAAVALAAFVAASIAAGAASIPALAAGAAGTLGFEAVATRRATIVRRYWERPVVQAAAITAALGLLVAGAAAAPWLLSAGVGALGAYLVVLALASCS